MTNKVPWIKDVVFTDDGARVRAHRGRVLVDVILGETDDTIMLDLDKARQFRGQLDAAIAEVEVSRDA